MSEVISASQNDSYAKTVSTSARVLVLGAGMNHSGSDIASVGWTIELPRVVSVYNSHGSQVLYVGWGSDVSTSNGLPIPAGESRKFRLSYLDEMWAVASGAGTVALVTVVHGKGAVFSPLDLSPAAWFDASDESTITDTGGAVDTWADKSGNGYDLTQATAANKPTTGTRTLNGLNVLDFDGSSDYLQVAFGATLTQPNTIFMVFELESGGGTRFLYDGIDASNRHVIYRSSGIYRAFAGVDQGGGSADTDPHISRAVFNGTSSSLFIDGSSNIATSDFGSQSLTGFTLGARYSIDNFFSGAIAELIIVDGTLTAGQISATETYLADKWGISI